MVHLGISSKKTDFDTLNLVQIRDLSAVQCGDLKN